MANKYTKMIDEIFKKWDPTGTTKYIYIGYCHQGDEDGGCGKYDHICDGYWEVEDQYPYTMVNEICFFYVPEDSPKLSDEEYEEKRKEYKKDYDNLRNELLKSFGNELKPNYSHTNCYWYRHYFITRDYKITSLVSRGDMDNGWTVVCDKIATMNDDDAKNAADMQLLDAIKNNCSSIENLLRSFEYKSNKDKAIEKIKLLLKG